MKEYQVTTFNWSYRGHIQTLFDAIITTRAQMKASDYAEEMMLEAGLFDNSPRSREIIYNFMRLRALRVEVDVKLALGLFTIDQAAEYLQRTVPMDRQTAGAEAAFFDQDQARRFHIRSERLRFCTSSPMRRVAKVTNSVFERFTIFCG